MKIFVDTADIEEIKEAASWGLLDGVTTNPSLVAKTGKDFKTVVREICDVFDEHGIRDASISAEVLCVDNADEMVSQAEELAKIHKYLTIKLPMNTAGLKAAKILAKKGIKTNVTLVFSASQALMAAKAHATYVSPFLGRLDDKFGDGTGIKVLQDIVKIYRNYNFETKVLAASIRSIEHVSECALAGADVATIPFKILSEMQKHELTDAGIKKFCEDAEKTNQQI